jgi:hypothetical protein
MDRNNNCFGTLSSYNEYRRQVVELSKVNRLRKEINASGISDNERADLYKEFASLAKQMQKQVV